MSIEKNVSHDFDGNDDYIYPSHPPQLKQQNITHTASSIANTHIIPHIIDKRPSSSIYKIEIDEQIHLQPDMMMDNETSSDKFASGFIAGDDITNSPSKHFIKDIHDDGLDENDENDDQNNDNNQNRMSSNDDGEEEEEE
eukprot:411061_1